MNFTTRVAPIAAALLFAGAANASFTLALNTGRYGDGTGAGNIYNVNYQFLANDSGPGASAPTVSRPSGSTTWSNQSNPYSLLQAGPSGSNVTDAQANAFFANELVGAWSATQDAFSASVTIQANDYVAPSATVPPRLTAASLAQLYAIRDQGLTGTFSFDLMVPMAGAGGGVTVFQSGGAGAVTSIAAGATSFSCTFETGFGSTMRMSLMTYESRSLGTSGFDLVQYSSIIYGRNAVPAPGAAALLAMAGLVGRRRRRSQAAGAATPAPARATSSCPFAAH